MDANIINTILRYDQESPETWRSSGHEWKTGEEEYMEKCDGFCSRDSDDSPILSYRYEKYKRYAPYTSSPRKHTDERDRRSMGRFLAKLFMFCTAMILFCVLMYIPVYSKVNRQFTRGIVTGWSYQTNRDTKVYIKPENITTIFEPNDICPKTRDKRLFLLVVVISSTINFKERQLIRESWGSYRNYLELSQSFHSIREKYKNYNYTYDLFPDPKEIDNKTTEIISKLVDINKNNGRKKRSISGLNQLLPSLAEALKDKLERAEKRKAGSEKTDLDEKRFEDDDDVDEDDIMLSEFDMNKVIGDKNDGIDYDYDTNVMKIPPRGYEEPTNIVRVMNLLKDTKLLSNSSKVREDNKINNVDDIVQGEPDFKVVFLLGLPKEMNGTDVQSKIDAEVEKYGDIIQEDIVDTYNNLTLKSIMMLKWVVKQCNDTVRYILKTDDDMFVNMPNLITSLRSKSVEFDGNKKDNNTKEYLLIGDLISGAKPVLDHKNKWFSPRYMYSGRIYPKYLSGTGYAFSSGAGKALYEAALHTPYFHLEDIYITGMCAGRAKPRLTPKDVPGFSYQRQSSSPCALYAQITAHKPQAGAVAELLRMRRQTPEARAALDRCERIRLTQIRKDRLKAKAPTKKSSLPKHIFHKFI